MVDLKKTTIEVGALVCDVFYLLARFDETPPNDQYARAPIAPGMARFWMDQEEKAVKAGHPADTARRLIKEWDALAKVTWRQVCTVFCDTLVDALPVMDAFCVVPSSRDHIRDELVTAMRARFPAASELVYTKEPDFFFGNATQMEIAAASRRQDAVTLPEPAVVVVADDWCGNGTTFRAFVERISTDHPNRTLRFVGAFPGISAPALPRPT
jgi:hypothetical protein